MSMLTKARLPELHTFASLNEPPSRVTGTPFRQLVLLRTKGLLLLSLLLRKSEQKHEVAALAPKEPKKGGGDPELRSGSHRLNLCKIDTDFCT